MAQPFGLAMDACFNHGKFDLPMGNSIYPWAINFHMNVLGVYLLLRKPIAVFYIALDKCFKSIYSFTSYHSKKDVLTNTGATEK